MNSAALFKQVAVALANEGERKKYVEGKLATQLEQTAEVIEAVRHIAKNRSGKIGTAGEKGIQLPLSGSGVSPLVSDDDLSANSHSHSSIARIKSLSSMALAAGLGLPANTNQPNKPPTNQSTANAGTTTSTNSSDDSVTQTARDLALLESELPSLRTLKQERTQLLYAASEKIPHPPAPPFPLQGMIVELELAKLKQSELTAAHSMMLAFLDNFPTILAQLKFRLCTRWARFSVGLSTGLYENVEHMELLGTRLADALQQVQRLYNRTKARRTEYLTSSVGSSGANPSTSLSGTNSITTSFKEDLLHSEDMERYFRWIIPTMTASKDFNRFLIQCKWMAFVWTKSASTSSSSYIGPTSEILEQYYLMRANPHIIDRDEELKSINATTIGSTSTGTSTSLHSLLAETRAKLKTKRRYALHLPCRLFDETAIHAAIARVGTLSLVTPLDYENGHPLLNQILKIFPSLFEELVKRRTSRMRSSASAMNIEMDRSAGITYIKHANWIPFLTTWSSKQGKQRDKQNVIMRERLNAITTLDSELLTENAFIDHSHLEFVLSRLKQLSAMTHAHTINHLKTDTTTNSKLDAHLAGLRKHPHHIMFLNYNMIGSGGQPTTNSGDKKEGDMTESDVKSSDSAEDIHASIIPPLPPSTILSSNVLVPPLPAVAFIPILPTPSVANSNAGLPIVSTTIPTGSTTAASPSASTAPPLNANSSAANAATMNSAAPSASTLPPHKLHILYAIRFLRIRTLKDRVTSILNFQRSIQRKLTLDLYGYGFEDRFQFNSEHIIRTVPHTAPSPLRAIEKMTNAASSASTTAGGATASASTMSRKGGSDSSTLFTIEGGHGLTTRLPRPHTHLGTYLPTDYETNESLFMTYAGIERRDDSYKWRSGREKHVDEWEGEIQVDDCCGVPIMYDVALNDFDALEEELMTLGSYYLLDHRARPDVNGATHDLVDRWALLVDLWEAESEFQVMKSRLLDIYLEIYEHTLARTKQEELIIRMLELMELRPYIEIGQPTPQPGQATYFTQFYAMHVKLLSQQILFLRSILDWQMSHEKQQSKRWDGQDWRVFLQTEKQIKQQDQTNGSTSVTATHKRRPSKSATKNRPGVLTPGELKLSRKLARATAKAAKAAATTFDERSVVVKDGDGDEDEEEDEDETSNSDEDNSSEEEQKSTAPTISPATNERGADSDKDTLLEKLSSLQIANSPSPFCRSFRVGMLDVLPSVSLVIDLLAVMEDTTRKLMKKCTGGGFQPQPTNPNEPFTSIPINGLKTPPPSSRSSDRPHRPMNSFDKMVLELAVLQHTSYAWSQHCQLKNSTFYDGSPHREILLSLEMSQVLHDPRAARAAIHSYENSPLAMEAANLLSLNQPQVDPSQDVHEKKDADSKNKLSVSSIQARKLKRLSNLVEIEDEDEQEEAGDETSEGGSPIKGMSPRALKKLVQSSPKGKSIVGAGGFSITISSAAAPAQDTTATAISPRSLNSQRVSSPATSSHVELVVLAAQEKIKLLICINLLEALSMTNILLQQVFESHVLTLIYRQQAYSIGLSSVRTLIDPYAVASGEPSIEDPVNDSRTSSSAPSSFILAIMETEETLPIALSDFTKVDQHLRLDPYLFHGYDQTMLGTSPAVTPGPGMGRASPTSGLGGSLDSDGPSGTNSWSARTSLIAYQPSGRTRRYFHRPHTKPILPPSTAIIKSLNSSKSTKSPAAADRPSLNKSSSLSLTGQSPAGDSSPDEQTNQRQKDVEQLLSKVDTVVKRLGPSHRRSVSAGNLTTIQQPAFSSTSALAAIASLKPLNVDTDANSMTIEIMDDPLTSSAITAAKTKKAAKSVDDSNLLPTNSTSSLVTRPALPPTELEHVKRSGIRVRSHSQWQIPSYAAITRANGSLDSPTQMSPRQRQNSTTPEPDIPSPTSSTHSNSSHTSSSGVPLSVLEANLPSVEQHLVKAQKRSLVEAQKSRAREKIRRARTQRVQAEREMAEEEKARRDALKAEEPKELCELWLLAFRRIVQAQCQHKHVLTVAVQFHDLLAEQDDPAIEYLPYTNIYANSSVALIRGRPSTQGTSSGGLGHSSIGYYSSASSAAASVRPSSPPTQLSGGGLNYLRVGHSTSVGPSRSFGGSMTTSMMATPHFAHSSTASPGTTYTINEPYPLGDYTRVDGVIDIRVGCLTPKTFLYLDGLKKSLFDAFQTRQHFNHANIGLTHAVAGLASAEEHENSSAITSTKHQPHKHSLDSTAGLISPPLSTPLGAGNQMLWLRTKKDQDKLDGNSLHLYNLDILNALVYHIYILETSQLAQQFAYIHTVIFNGGTKQSSVTLTMPSLATRETISPFIFSSRIRDVDLNSNGPLSPPSPVPTRPNTTQTKYARLKSLPQSDSTKPQVDEASEGDTKSFMNGPTSTASDELTVEDLFCHLNQLIIDITSQPIRTKRPDRPPPPKTTNRSLGSRSKSKGASGLNSGSRSSLHSSTPGSPRSSSKSLTQTASTAQLPQPQSQASAQPTNQLESGVTASASVPPPAAVGSVAALLLPDDDTYSSDDDPDSDPENDLLNDGDEQYFLDSTTSLGRIKSNGQRISATSKSSTAFLFRIPRPAALLALLQDERQSVISVDKLKLDLLARQLMFDIFQLSHAMVILEDLGMIAQPITTPPTNTTIHPHHPAVSMPQMYAAFLNSSQMGDSSHYASPPTEFAALLPFILTDEQKKRLSIMIQRHVVINGREIASKSIETRTVPRTGATINQAVNSSNEAHNVTGLTDNDPLISSDGAVNLANIFNGEGGTRLVLDVARRISGLPDSFWSALIDILRTKRSTLINQLQLFVRVHHERMIVKSNASTTSSSASNGVASSHTDDLTSDNSSMNSQSVSVGGYDSGVRPLGGDHLLRPSYLSNQSALDASRHSRTIHVLLKEYEDISDRTSFSQPNAELLAGQARASLLFAGGRSLPTSTLIDTSCVLTHPFLIHRYNRELPGSHGGPANLFEQQLLIQSQPDHYQRISGAHDQPAGQPPIKTELGAWNREIQENYLLPPDTLKTLLPALSPLAGSPHLTPSVSIGSNQAHLRRSIEEIFWQFLPSSHRTRSIVSTHWRSFVSQVHAIGIVRALDAPKSVQGDRALKRARRLASESYQRPQRTTLEERVMKEVQASEFERKLGVWKKQKGQTPVNAQTETTTTNATSAINVDEVPTTTDNTDSAAPTILSTTNETDPAPSVTQPVPSVAPPPRTTLIPSFSLENDLDAMEGTTLKLQTLNLFLETTLTLVKLFDIYSALKLQIVPCSPIDGRYMVGGGHVGREECYSWALDLQANVLTHFKSSHIMQALQWFGQDILFRIRHPKKMNSSHGPTHTPYTSYSTSSSNSSDSNGPSRRSRAEGYWSLIAQRIRQPAWLKQYQVNAGLSSGLLGLNKHKSTQCSQPQFTSSSQILAYEANQLELAFSSYRRHPGLQRHPFKSYHSFSDYALTLTHVEQEECIRFLKLDIEVMLLKQSILALNQTSQYILQKYMRKDGKAMGGGGITTATAHSATSMTTSLGGGIDFISKVPPIHLLLLHLLPTKLSLGHLLDDPAIQLINNTSQTQHSTLGSNLLTSSYTGTPPSSTSSTGSEGAVVPSASTSTAAPLYPHSSNPQGYFVIGEHELHKALNTFARSLLFFAERSYGTQLIGQLEWIHTTNLKLFSTERSIHCLRSQLQYHLRQCLITSDCNLFDINYPLIQIEHINLRQSLQEQRQLLRIQTKSILSSVRHEYDHRLLELLRTLHHIRGQFKRTKTFLERTVGHNIKRVKDEVMVAFLDGEFSQRSLFQLFRLQKKTREEKRLTTVNDTLTAKPANDDPLIQLDEYVSNDFLLAKQQVDSLKSALLQLKSDFQERDTTASNQQSTKVASIKSTLSKHSLLTEKLSILQLHEKSIIQTMTELRYLLFNSEMESENYKRLMSKLMLEKKRLTSWRTDHIFRYQELKYRTAKYTRLQNITDIRQARERLEFSELELKRLGREEIAHTIHQVQSEQQFETALAEAENELINQRLKKLEVFNEMKESISRHSGHGLTGALSGSGHELTELERLNYHKRLWDRCLFQTHVMQSEQLCVDLEAENETLRQVIQQKQRSQDYANQQGAHQQTEVTEEKTPALDGPRKVLSQPVTVPQANLTLFPHSLKVDSWNGPANELKPMVGVSIDERAGEVYHSVHGFGPTSPVPPVPSSLYYFDPSGGGQLHTDSSALTSPFTKSFGSVFSNQHHKSSQLHPPPNQLTAHLHRVAHEHPISMYHGLGTDPHDLARGIDAALGIPNSPHALMQAAGVEPKPILAQHSAGTSSSPLVASSSLDSPQVSTPLVPPSFGRRPSKMHHRLVGARLHSKLFRESLDINHERGSQPHGYQLHAQPTPTIGVYSATRPRSRPGSSLGSGLVVGSNEFAPRPPTQDELDEEAAALRADQEVEEAITFPMLERNQSQEPETGTMTKTNDHSRTGSSISGYDVGEDEGSQRLTSRPSSNINHGDNDLTSASSQPQIDGARVLAAVASASSPTVDIGTMGRMDMLAWQQEILKKTYLSTKSAKQMDIAIPAHGSIKPVSDDSRHTNDWQGYSIMGRSNIYPGSLSARGMDTEPPSSNEPHLGSSTSRRYFKNVTRPHPRPQPREAQGNTKPTVTRPPPPVHRPLHRRVGGSTHTNSVEPSILGLIAPSISNLHVTKPSTHVYTTHAHPTPTLALLGTKPPQAQPHIIPPSPSTTTTSNPSLHSGHRARAIHHAQLVDGRTGYDLRQANDRSFQESKFDA